MGNPRAEEYVPDSQKVQVEAPSLAKVPGKHDKHLDELVIPDPVRYDPAAHGAHGPPSGPVKPGVHVQFCMKFENMGLVENGGHRFSTPVQHQEPAGHGMQGVLLKPEKPLSQKHCIGDRDLTAAVVAFGVQGVDILSPGQKNPIGHSLQPVVLVPNRPGTHLQSSVLEEPCVKVLVLAGQTLMLPDTQNPPTGQRVQF